MCYIVYGAGGIGSVKGASLSSHGHQVVLVGNREHVESVRREGLRFITPDETTTLRVKAFETADQVAPFGDGDVVKLGRFLGMDAPYDECLWRVSTEMALKNEKPGRYSGSDLERMIAARSWPSPRSG